MSGIDPKTSVPDALLKNKIEEVKRNADNPGKLKETANQFEALFVNYLLQNMRKTVMKSGLLNDGLGGNIMLSLFDQQLSQKISADRNLGIAEMLMQELTQRAEAEATPNPSLRELPLRRNKYLLSKAKPYLTQNAVKKISPYNRHIDQAARRTGVDSDLIRSVILAESGGNPSAVSHKNARGLMQLIDSTAAEMGVQDSLDPEQNIHGGAKYLALLLDRFSGDTRRALAAYNAGPAAVEKHGGIPPYRETRRYVNRVLAYYRQLKKQGVDEKK